uniref:DUF834 domain-containing protein n=1 Tax=Oryza meridionalis TaxID=40149 RepID=A0A0E0DZK1_9ORYZ
MVVVAVLFYWVVVVKPERMRGRTPTGSRRAPAQEGEGSTRRRWSARRRSVATMGGEVRGDERRWEEDDDAAASATDDDYGGAAASAVDDDAAEGRRRWRDAAGGVMSVVAGDVGGYGCGSAGLGWGRRRRCRMWTLMEATAAVVAGDGGGGDGLCGRRERRKRRARHVGGIVRGAHSWPVGVAGQIWPVPWDL